MTGNIIALEQGYLDVDDIEILCAANKYEKPSFYGKSQKFNREFWLGHEVISIINDTKALGPIEWRKK